MRSLAAPHRSKQGARLNQIANASRDRPVAKYLDLGAAIAPTSSRELHPLQIINDGLERTDLRS